MPRAELPADSNARRANPTASTATADTNPDVHTVDRYPSVGNDQRRATTPDTTSARPSDAQSVNNAAPADSTERSDDPEANTSDTTEIPKADSSNAPANSPTAAEKSQEEKARQFISDLGIEDGYVNVVVVFKRNHERATYRMTYSEARRLANDFVNAQTSTEPGTSALAGVYEACYVNRAPCFLAVRLSDVLYIG